MSLLGLIIAILLIFIVTGILLWLVNNFIPMEAKLKSAMNTVVIAIVVIVVVLYLLSAFGVLDAVNIGVPRLR